MASHPAVPRRQVLLAGLAGLAAGLGLPARAQSPDDGAPPLPALGSPLAVPAATLLDGRAFKPAEAEGRVLVLYWWASWCPFCALQSPLIDRLWRQHQAQGLQVLGLSIDRRAEDATRYLAQRGYAFPSAWVTPAMARALPKPKGLPVTLVRGRDGLVKVAEAGQLFPEDVEQFARFL